jgi:putative DNA primase/helicase
MGSIAFVAAARAAFAVLEDPNDRDRRLFLHAKSNLAEPSQGLAFRLERRVVGEGIVTSRVDWEPDPITMTADEALVAAAGSSRGPSAVEEAKNFLQDLLAEEPLSVNDVKSETEAAGLSWATVTRAKTKLGIKPVKAGMGGGWYWALSKARNPSEDAHLKDVSTFDTDEHLREPTKSI